MTKHLNRCPEKSLAQAQAIYDWVIGNLSADTAKRFIMYMKACCDWGKEHKLITQNPFNDMKPVKVKNVQMR